MAVLAILIAGLACLGQTGEQQCRDAGAGFVTGKHDHCICPPDTRCTGESCSVAISKPNGQKSTSGFRTDCIDCRCVGKSQLQSRWRTKQIGSPTEFVFVTAASFNHVCPLLEMLESLKNQDKTRVVVVYDLDNKSPYLDIGTLKAVNINVILRSFDYDIHPSHFNISEHAGQYAWKPVIIKEVVDEFGAALWVDSGNRLQSIDKVVKAMSNPSGFYSPSSPGNIWKWVHAGMMAYFGIAKCCNPDQADTKPCCCCGGSSSPCLKCEVLELENRPKMTTLAQPKDWLDKEMCNGALLGFVKGFPAYERVLVPWVECAFDKRCIAPVFGTGRGSEATRGNHRQDQAGVSMLVHFAGLHCNSHEHDAGFMLHRDRTNDNPLCQKYYGGRLILPEHDRNPK